MPHPADVWPRPTAAPDITIQRFDGADPEGIQQLQGRFYIDGSCTSHVIRELRRAGWAIVVQNDEGQVIARISSPLWEDLPQTPQAVEFVAYSVAAQFIAGHTTIYGDCANVVRQATAAPKASVAPNKRYSGVMRDTLKFPHRLRHITAFEKK